MDEPREPESELEQLREALRDSEVLRAAFLDVAPDCIVSMNGDAAIRADGSEFPVELTLTRAPLPGPPSFTAFIRDLTDRRQVEQALRESEGQLRQAHKMEAIGQFAGGIAHDLLDTPVRTPAA